MEHFQFFKSFDEPFFGVTVELDCTKVYSVAKKEGFSFFLYYLHKSLVVANSIEEFKYRIDGDEVLVFDQVHASPTINRENGTFGFAYIDFYDDYIEFQKKAKEEIQRVQSTSDLIPSTSSENVIHYSSLPWLNFTSISHARSFSHQDSCPKISFGKLHLKDGKHIMPMSIHVNHALMDGFQVGQYVERYQELLNNI